MKCFVMWVAQLQVFQPLELVNGAMPDDLDLRLSWNSRQVFVKNTALVYALSMTVYARIGVESPGHFKLCSGGQMLLVLDYDNIVSV